MFLDAARKQNYKQTSVCEPTHVMQFLFCNKKVDTYSRLAAKAVRMTKKQGAEGERACEKLLWLSRTKRRKKWKHQWEEAAENIRKQYASLMHGPQM